MKQRKFREGRSKEREGEHKGNTWFELMAYIRGTRTRARRATFSHTPFFENTKQWNPYS